MKIFTIQPNHPWTYCTCHTTMYIYCLLLSSTFYIKVTIFGTGQKFNIDLFQTEWNKNTLAFVSEAHVLWKMQRCCKNVYDSLKMYLVLYSTCKHIVHVINIFVNWGWQNVCCSTSKVVPKSDNNVWHTS